MSSLILPQKWTRQPQVPVEIDWSNPLAQRCVGAYLPANNNLKAGGPSLIVSNFGVGYTFLRTSSQHITIPLTSPISLTSSGATLIGIFNSTDIAAGQCAFALTDGGSHFSVLLRGDLAGDPISVASWNTSGSSFRQFRGPSYASGVNYVVAITTDTAGNFDIYLDGVLQSGSYTNGGTIPSVSMTKLEIGASTGTGDFLSGSVFSALAFKGRLNQQEIKVLSDNPWQIFKSQSRRIFVASAGGGDATATITGVSGSAQVGTVSTSGNASVSLPGASGAGSVGNVVASVSAATAITGVNGAGQVGNTTQTGAANVAVSTVAGTGQVGTVSASGIGAPDGNVAITGIAGTGQVGTLAASGNGAVSITGIAATGSVGSVTPSVTVTTTITGAIGTGSVGTTTQTGAANATVSSAVGIGLVGTVSATGTSQDGNAVISGISGIGSVGIVSANDGTVVNNHGFIIIDTEPRLWWKRKPSKLDDKKAEEKIFKVARVIERVVKHVANSNEPSVSKEVYRKAAYAEVAPLLREMPGFDWSPMFRAILTQSKLQEQNRIAAEQAGILAKQEIERIKRIRDDEEALIVLLMGA